MLVRHRGASRTPQQGSTRAVRWRVPTHEPAPEFAAVSGAAWGSRAAETGNSVHHARTLGAIRDPLGKGLYSSHMTRTVIIGNSGSGKSTLARAIASSPQIAHLDLDTIAWQAGARTQRRNIEEASAEMLDFITAHQQWVVEGCYGSLAAFALPHCDVLIYLDPDTSVCLEHCRARPFEPHKFASPEAQDAALDYLLEWVEGYDTRDDDMSRQAHQDLVATFTGPVVHLESKTEIDALVTASQGLQS